MRSKHFSADNIVISMDDSLYDEFGNYIGPEIESDRDFGAGEEDKDLPDKADEEAPASDDDNTTAASAGWITSLNDVVMDNQVLLAEDKKYYLTAEEVYGEDVETLVMDEDEQPLEQPIIKPVRNIKFELGVKDSSTYVDTKFLLGLMSNPLLWGTSSMAVPMSLVLEDSNAKSYLCNIMDTPGHVDFSDEMTAALRLADGAVLIVDAAEGVMADYRIKIAPKDAYHKLRHTIEVINNHIFAASSTAGGVQTIDPAAGNVCFASSSASWSFTLQSFAKLYVKLHRVPFDATKFASRLWGDMHYHPDARPLYKFYSQIIGEHRKSVEATLAELGVTLSNAAYKLNVIPLLRLACSSVFGTATGFTDMLIHHIPSAKDATAKKVKHIYTGPTDSSIFKAMEDCDPTGPLMINVTKLYPKSDCSVFDAFGRVYSGKIQTGQTVLVLGEGYSPDDEEDMTIKEVTKLWQRWLVNLRCFNPFVTTPPGCWVLIEGVAASIMKTAMLCNVDYDEDVYIFRPLKFNTLPVVKTATEPLNPSELPKMVEGLGKISKSYPLAITKIEVSGEHIILGTGELYLDSIMKDLRELYSEVEVKVLLSFNFSGSHRKKLSG
ncbi:hypothetical protein NE237_026406 [Protea cynaroides]|uniref:Uncharacterized protein n=1 Tax=Protea cynaroides TaxID=273540 RepID=A0A9Q0H4V5_9MAGN|nr:hypothetical protein NE237_026406 [Protea cynaroides]